MSCSTERWGEPGTCPAVQKGGESLVHVLQYRKVGRAWSMSCSTERWGEPGTCTAVQKGGESLVHVLQYRKVGRAWYMSCSTERWGELGTCPAVQKGGDDAIKNDKNFQTNRGLFCVHVQLTTENVDSVCS